MTAKTHGDPTATERAYHTIWDTIARVPKGCVATYGQIASLAGYPKRPRLTAQALRHVPDSHPVPWHRIINAQGKISIPPDDPGHYRQRELLQAEGVIFTKDRVDLEQYRWRPRSDLPFLD
ncbi:MGMT family protein [Sinimarinibacterium sp. NLF-5-8]|uniref:MGMT family protein n=1 Tax=Sinimarinibacterium sp. NLF-5-8 TaxID=2698684 RepID=UPI00137B986F|nr:MGMT family protein [Sinimarinibacterium sp. NLF-5-8]QHS10798.1 methyltransferase [Sinimarinibacterium sp. NLF-5-8]